MKIACTADWHIHQFQDFSKSITVKWDNTCKRFRQNKQGKFMNSRLLNILSGICDIRDYCTQHNIKYILNAGDIFHKRGTISVETFNAAYKVIESFSECGLKLITIAGNHDQVDSSANPSTSIYTLQKLITVVEEPSVIQIEEFNVCCIPYNRNKDSIVKYINEFLKENNSHNNILLAHLGITGAAVGSGMHLMADEYNLKDLRPNDWKYVVLGHYHRPQLLSSNVFYCGTPVQNSFNDELSDTEHQGYNGFYVIDLNESIDFIPIYQPRFITVNNLQDIPSDTLNFFRVKIDSNGIEEVNTEGLSENIRVEIKKNYEEPQRSTIEISDDFQVAVKKYVKEQGFNSPGLEQLGLNILFEAVTGGV